MHRSEFLLSNGESLIIAHNLEKLGMDIQICFESWILRTDRYTDESFCSYLKSKDPRIVALTEDELIGLMG